MSESETTETRPLQSVDEARRVLGELIMFRETSNRLSNKMNEIDDQIVDLEFGIGKRRLLLKEFAVRNCDEYGEAARVFNFKDTEGTLKTVRVYVIDENGKSDIRIETDEGVVE